MSVFQIQSNDGIVYVRDSGLSSADDAAITALSSSIDDIEDDLDSIAEGFEGGTW